MQQKIDNKTVRVIISFAILGAIAALLAQLIDFGSDEFDANVDHLLFAIGASAMGVIFFVMKRKNITKYAAESFEILFFIIVPLTSFIPILSDPNMHFAFFFPVYYGGVNAWLLASKHFIFDPLDTDEKRISWTGIKQLWGMLMFLSVLIFPLYFIWVQNN
ncbi:hypothetical protein [Candidatus Nitrosotenuis uzonensis]|uniref:Uncharacterized protein n=1 Tax=Candidatus Nitrosotenuis uzonensis TaxID=1407055 RepID=V6AQT3_9ARCH|nr:hypothetical protein [Candidatus Nitrosotenuis uzonensis]CDI04939.1 membrane hypothetical protein [Candidatus Nitrosotenuis uzonensis]